MEYGYETDHSTLDAHRCGGYFLYLREKLRFTPPVDSRDAARRVWETL